MQCGAVAASLGFPFVEVGAVGGTLDVLITAQTLALALGAGFEADVIQARIEQVARRQAAASANSNARRVTRLIVRDGDVVWAFARRPATGNTWSYTARGIEVPVPSAAVVQNDD